MDDDDFIDGPDDFEDDDHEPVGDCDNCGSNYYAEEDDGSGLCDQCQWWAAFARGEVPYP